MLGYIPLPNILGNLQHKGDAAECFFNNQI